MPAQYSCSIFIHTHRHKRTHAKNLFSITFCIQNFILYTVFYIVYSILYCIQYKINRKMKMLQEYWATTVIFIGIFSHCIKVQHIVPNISTILHKERCQDLMGFWAQSGQVWKVCEVITRAAANKKVNGRNPQNWIVSEVSKMFQVHRSWIE